MPRRADSLQAFPAQFGVNNPGPNKFYAALSPFAPSKGESMPFFAVRMPPGIRGASHHLSRADVQPTISIDPRNGTAGDSVTLQFAVDGNGVPVRSTMRLLRASYIEYAQVVVGAALRSVYLPAMRGLSGHWPPRANVEILEA